MKKVTKKTTKKKPVSRKPHTTAKPTEGHSKQVGYMIDDRFHKTFVKAAADRGFTFSDVTRGLQEKWLQKQLDRKRA